VNFCGRNHIRKLYRLGSALTPRFRPESDIDVLVEFDPDQILGLLTLAGMEIEISERLGRRVDRRTAEDLSRYFRDEVVASALPQFERTGRDARLPASQEPIAPHVVVREIQRERR
jgi:uncharacterized protein